MGTRDAGTGSHSEAPIRRPAIVSLTSNTMLPVGSERNPSARCDRADDQKVAPRPGVLRDRYNTNRGLQAPDSMARRCLAITSVAAILVVAACTSLIALICVGISVLPVILFLPTRRVLAR